MGNENIHTIDEYISTFPPEIQARLEEIRAVIRRAIPEADEVMKWNRPAFIEESILVMFGGFKNHVGFYVTPSTLNNFEEDLLDFKVGKGSVQFPHEDPLPAELIRKMTEYRDWESKEKGVNWKS